MVAGIGQMSLAQTPSREEIERIEQREDKAKRKRSRYQGYALYPQRFAYQRGPKQSSVPPVTWNERRWLEPLPQGFVLRTVRLI